MIYNSILESIGNTPLIRINRLNPNGAVTVAAKLESRNPGGSIKERISLSMIEAGERSGDLTRDKIVLEATSGNTGIGLAMVCAAKGYRCVLVMPESASIERRRKIMQAYGAEILLTPAKRATDGAIEKSYCHGPRISATLFPHRSVQQRGELAAHYEAPHRRSGSRPTARSPIWWPRLAPRARSWGCAPGSANFSPRSRSSPSSRILAIRSRA
jgi:cysteinyl-tRNA synthetase